MIVGPVTVNVVVCFTFVSFLTTTRSERDGKSLLSSFPFNHSEHLQEQHGDGRNSRQGYGGEDDVNSVSFDEISTGEKGANGKEGTDYCSDCYEYYNNHRPVSPRCS